MTTRPPCANPRCRINSPHAASDPDGLCRRCRNGTWRISPNYKP